MLGWVLTKIGFFFFFIFLPVVPKFQLPEIMNRREKVSVINSQLRMQLPVAISVWAWPLEYPPCSFPTELSAVQLRNIQTWNNIYINKKQNCITVQGQTKNGSRHLAIVNTDFWSFFLPSSSLFSAHCFSPTSGIPRMLIFYGRCKKIYIFIIFNSFLRKLNATHIRHIIILLATTFDRKYNL